MYCMLICHVLTWEFSKHVTAFNMRSITIQLQTHEQFVSAYLSKGDWNKEAYWIYDRAFGNSAIISQEEELRVIADIDKEEIVQEIMFVLMQLHVLKCEVMCIQESRINFLFFFTWFYVGKD